VIATVGRAPWQQRPEAYSSSSNVNLCQPSWEILGFILLELVLLAGSRDSLRKYYLRVERLLGTLEAPERSVNHDERFSQGEENEREGCHKETGTGEASTN
jgi:hypothetical protein